MKKIFFTCLVAIAGVAGITGLATQTYGQTALTAMQLENIEALTASEESSKEEHTCYYSYMIKDSSSMLFCGSCELVKNATNSSVSMSGKCSK